MDQINIAMPAGGSGPEQRSDNLALAYQEILTVVARLRANRQAVTDAATFRGSMKAALSAAEAEATRKGYTPADARLGTFAVVTFLDESVENTNDPAFRDWARLPLLADMFGEPGSGEVFFQCIDRLLARPDSPQDADVLEVFALCLLLGYRGRYRANEQAVPPIVTTITHKLQRIRGPLRLGADWAPLQDAALQPPDDPWVRAFMLGTGGALFFAILFFIGFKLHLAAGASGLHAISQLAAH